MEGKKNAGTKAAWPYGANGTLVAALLSEGFEVRLAESIGWAIVAAKRGCTVSIRQLSPRSGIYVGGRMVKNVPEAIEATLEKIAEAEGSDIDDRALSAVETFFEKRGAKVIGKKWSCPSGCFDLVVDEGGRIAFVYVRVSKQGGAFETDLPDLSLEDREACMLRWIEEHPAVPGTSLGFDVVIVNPTALGTATIRHHVNAYESAKEE